jgi:hypothetical protein
MILAIINMKAGNYYLQRAFLEPLQELSDSFTPALFTDDNGKHGISDHKPPKSSYSKNDGLSNVASLLHITPSPASRICFSEPFTALPEVFAEIDVPPKISPLVTIIFKPEKHYKGFLS